MFAEPFASIARERVERLIDDQVGALQLSERQAMVAGAARGFSRMDGGTALKVTGVYLQGARERGVGIWAVLKEMLDSIALPYGDEAFGPALKGFLEELAQFGDLRGQVQRLDKHVVNAGAMDQLLGEIDAAIRAAQRQLQSDADLFIAARRSKNAAAAAPEREKQQKFGILDAPNLYAQDIARGCGPLGAAVIYFDIDNFKTVNTQLTETKVDEVVLPPLNLLIRDYVSHLGYGYAEGGDEFKIFMPNATGTIAGELAEHIRGEIEALRISAAPELRLTASFGVAHAKPGRPLDELSSRANVAKNQAKAAGKNRVVVV